MTPTSLTTLSRLLNPGQATPGQSRPSITAAPTPAEMKLQISNEPLSLVYRTAVQKLNELLAPDLGDKGLQGLADSGIDFSPQAVADRILSFATAGLGSYRDRHPTQGQDEQLNGFVGLIRDAIDQGFAEARHILDGLGVLNGDIAASTDQTHALIQDGLDRFAQQARQSASDGTGDGGQASA